MRARACLRAGRVRSLRGASCDLGSGKMRRTLLMEPAEGATPAAPPWPPPAPGPRAKAGEAAEFGLAGVGRAPPPPPRPTAAATAAPRDPPRAFFIVPEKTVAGSAPSQDAAPGKTNVGSARSQNAEQCPLSRCHAVWWGRIAVDTKRRASRACPTEPERGGPGM